MELLENGIILTDVDVEPSWKIIGELLEQRAELLEALKQAIAWIDGEKTPINAMTHARATIASAEAEE